MSSTSSVAPIWSFNLVSDAPALDAIYRLRQEVQASPQRRDQFRNLLDSIPDTAENAVRRGIGYWVLGRNVDTLETLKNSTGTYADLFRAKSLLASGSPELAYPIFHSLRNDEQIGHACKIGELECYISRADFDSLAKAMKTMPKSFAETADYQYYQGRIHETHGKHEAALESYEKALEIHPEHRKALFRLAYSLDLHGQDEEAQILYEKLVKIPPVDVAAMMNLAVLYEDRGDYSRAISCYDAILRSDPTNPRARLYRRDCELSLTMYYDETQERKDDKLQQTLRVPITDFELSVRARNCLTKMNIKYLGDLVRKSETELLSYKNFGETSLNEIKAILNSKNLRLGMLPPEKIVQPPPELGNVDPGLYAKPLLELDLSVRSRRTMEALNIRLVGELLQHSAEELLAMPNFGQTSLNEIRMKLRTLGVDVRDAKSGGRLYTFTPINAGSNTTEDELDADDDEIMDELPPEDNDMDDDFDDEGDDDLGDATDE